MPTGYTYPVIEGKIKTFPEFAMLCARAMDALVMMRDEPEDAPIPEKFEPSKYHAEKIEEAKRRLAELKAMPHEQRVQLGQAEKLRRVSSANEYIAKNTVANNRINEMLAKVVQWEAPADHQNFKKFMLEQLHVSKKNDDYWINQIKMASELDPLDVFTEALQQAQRDIEYHTKENAEEIERTNGRNEWLRQLRESLKEPANF